MKILAVNFKQIFQANHKIWQLNFSLPNTVGGVYNVAYERPAAITIFSCKSQLNNNITAWNSSDNFKSPSLLMKEKACVLMLIVCENDYAFCIPSFQMNMYIF